MFCICFKKFQTSNNNCTHYRRMLIILSILVIRMTISIPHLFVTHYHATCHGLTASTINMSKASLTEAKCRTLAQLRTNKSSHHNSSKISHHFFPLLHTHIHDTTQLFIYTHIIINKPECLWFYFSFSTVFFIVAIGRTLEQCFKTYS